MRSVLSRSTTLPSVAVLAAVTALALSTLAAQAPPAAAAKHMELAIADNPVFLYQAYYKRKKAFKQALPLGTTRLRVMLPWASAMTPRDAHKKKQPKKIHYTLHKWDDLIDAAAKRGIRVELILGPKIPAFASSKHQVGKSSPNAKKFGKFAKAMAKHFKGRVNRYSIWNEPNYVTWLKPSSKAPTIYRKLYLAGYKAIKKADKHAKVLIGELAPHASHASVGPLEFLRKIACVDSSFHRVGHCPRLHADGFAQHPYDFTTDPTVRHGYKNDFTISTLDKLTSALDHLRHLKALVAPHNAHMPIYLTEFGYFASGRRKIPDKTAANWLPKAYSIALHNPRVKEMTQYGLVSPPKKYRSGYFDLGLITLKGHVRKDYKSLRKWVKRAQKAHQIKMRPKKLKLHKARPNSDVGR